jgi:tripartite ATP-independent transporter DctM subunit
MLLLVAAILMTVFFAVGLHVATALGLLGVTMMHFFSDRPLLDMLGQIAWNTNSNFVLVAVPLFVMMGEVLLYGGVSEKLYTVLSSWLAPVRGGLLHSNIAFSAVFGAISGSSAASAATVGAVSLPSFLARGYSERWVVGSLAAGGTLDILIPPSISMVIYGVLAEESIGRLYLAGFIPGFLLSGVFMLIIYVATWLSPSIAPQEVAPPWGVRFLGLLSLFPVVMLMFLVLGTIYLGIATPTEAAAFGVVGAFVLAALNHKVSAQMLKDVLLTTVRTSSMIMLIVTSAFLLSFALSILHIPAQMAAWISHMQLTPVTFVIILVLFYLVLGTFMEALSMMVTTVPILVPVLKSMGVDLVWFGIIMVILLEAALVSPPEGLNLYVIHGIRKSVSEEAGIESGSMIDLWLGVLPFMLGMAVVIALIIQFPQIALWLPDLVKGK